MKNQRIIQVEEKVPVKLLIPLSIQHMFAMFGASVMVPFIFGINPAIVLFMNGLGTLLFILITKGKAPAYLGSSFAFLAPAGIVISKWGYSYALGGFVVVGLCGCVLALIIYKFGSSCFFSPFFIIIYFIVVSNVLREIRFPGRYCQAGVVNQRADFVVVRAHIHFHNHSFGDVAGIIA